MNNPFSLENKTILITGASSGIGRQCAITCSQMGANIIAIGRNETRLKETFSQLNGAGNSMYLFDFSSLGDINQLISQIASENGKLDGIICSAGVEKSAPIKLLKPSDYEEVIKINTISAFELVKQATRVGYINSPASVVFIASITAVIARQTTAAYSASKGALISGSRVMALELAKRKIRVNCISPGTVLTPLMQKYLSGLSEEECKRRKEGFPLGIGEPEDIANACVYLLSDASRWITGQNLIVDGGYTIK